MPTDSISNCRWQLTHNNSDRSNDSVASSVPNYTRTYKTASALSSSAPDDSCPPISESPTNDARRPFICRYTDCSKGFAQLAHLRIHERAHTGDRPYVCSFDGCGRAFSQHGNLKTHERRHTGEKPFKCTFPNCRKAFSQQGNLRTHERIHLRVRPYQCPHSGCDRSFNQRGNLKVSR
ncbi:hypothetical protein BDF19DRAFT_386934 [Syncephalis fuscata]|nr:hypothetical protein BDF19DRAFT_386934 [Syncephalis fuscata]